MIFLDCLVSGIDFKMVHVETVACRLFDRKMVCCHRALEVFICAAVN